MIVQLTLNYKNHRKYAEYVRKTVVNSKLRSQHHVDSVSVQNIAQLLLNLVTFGHGAA